MGAGVLGACMGDLADPTSCPPAAQHPEGNCVAAVSNPPPAAGCLKAPNWFTCLTGSRPQGAACSDQECPDTPGACYPAGDCPKAVTDAVPGATCFRLAPEDFTASPCTAGCARCAITCDGQGMAVGVVADPMAPQAPLTIDIARYMPASGQLGIYVSSRGLSRETIRITTATAPTPISYPLIAAVPDAQFVEHVFFKSPQAYIWPTSTTAPAKIQFEPTSIGNGGATLVEIDCIIPFVISGP